jgi:uncharacterized protein YpuA (DUF1002 family)
MPKPKPSSKNSLINTKPTIDDNNDKMKGTTPAAKTVSANKVAEDTEVAATLHTHSVPDLVDQAVQDMKLTLTGIQDGQAADTYLRLRNDVADRIVKTFARLRGTDWPHG